MIELTGHVIGCFRLGECRLVTRVTIYRQGLPVLAVYVTSLTVERDVFPGQRESRPRMVQLRWFPCGHPVAERTVMIELPRAVVRCDDRLEILLMAGPAIALQVFILSVEMTFRTISTPVCAEEREGCCTVIEARGFPCGRGMALHAILGKLVLCMTRLEHVREVLLMARVAIELKILELSVDMTFFARCRQMLPGEREPGSI